MGSNNQQCCVISAALLAGCEPRSKIGSVCKTVKHNIDRRCMVLFSRLQAIAWGSPYPQHEAASLVQDSSAAYWGAGAAASHLHLWGLRGCLTPALSSPPREHDR